MKIKKAIINLIIISILLFFEVYTIAAVNTEVSMSINKSTLKITSDEEISSIKIYKEIDGGYILFFKSQPEDKSKTI